MRRGIIPIIAGSEGAPTPPANSVYQVDNPNQDWVEFADAVAEPVAGQTIVVEAEIYIISHTNDVRNIATDALTPRSGAADTNWRLTVHSTNVIRFSVVSAGAFVHTESDVTVPVGQWSTVRGEYDGTDAFVVLNLVTGIKLNVATHQVNNPQPTWLVGANDTPATNAPAWNMQSRNVKVTLNGITRIDAPCNEGSGLVCVNNAGANGTISNARIHQPPL